MIEPELSDLSKAELESKLALLSDAEGQARRNLEGIVLERAAVDKELQRQVREELKMLQAEI